MEATPQRSVITIATSKKPYVDMACNLAMSFLLWNDTDNIRFVLVTDCPQFIPGKLKSRITVTTVAPGELGEGFSTKLHMDKFANAGQNLFIDADCLVYGDLSHAFDAFAGKAVSVVGYKRYSGEDIGFCTDIAKVMANTSINYYIMLCGSVYYFEKNKLATQVFDYARNLLPSYHQIGLVSLRGRENEEPLIAIAMAKFNQEPVNDTGLIKADRMYYEFLETNVVKGKARLWNTDKIPVPEYSTLKLATPAIVHFNAHYAESYEYESEVIRLKQVFLAGTNAALANIQASIFSVMPGKLKMAAKNIFRPLYKAIFGHRKIKTLERMQ